MASYTETTPVQVIINNVSREKYKELSVAGQLCADQVYVVKDVQLNAVGLKVQNVAEPTDLSDAANKAYVDTQISNSLSNYYDKSTIDSRFDKYTIINKLTQAEYDILSAAGQIKEDELYVITDAKTTDEILDSRLSSYYKKTETSSNAQLKTEFAKYQLTGDYRTGTQISAIAQDYANQVKISDYTTSAQASAIANAYASDVDSKLTAYYKKTETSSSVEIKNSFENVESQISSKVLIATGTGDFLSGNLSVNNLTKEQYVAKIKAGTLEDGVIYNITDQTYLDGYGQAIQNVGEPVLTDDAATKNYVDSISSKYQAKGSYLSATADHTTSAQASAIVEGYGYTKTYIDGKKDNLSVVHISEADYAALVKAGTTISNVIYVTSADYMNMYGEQIKNLGYPTDLSDAVTKQYVDDNSGKVFINGIKSELSIQNIDSDSYAALIKSKGILSNVFYVVSSENRSNYGQKLTDVAEPTLSDDAATKNYVDSAVSSSITSAQVSAIVDGYGYTKTYIDGGKNDISVLHISEADYFQLVKDEKTISNVIYITSADYFDMYGEQIKNLGYPTQLSDATTKEYVDQIKYVLAEAELKTCGDGLSCQISNYTITTVSISDASTSISVILPKQTDDDTVRDFMIRFENTDSSNATVVFVPYGDEDVDYEGADDDWATIEPGVNLVSFTETKR